MFDRSVLLFLVLGCVAACGEDDTKEETVTPVEPNLGVAFRGMDGAFTSDPLAAECADDPRNPGRVVLEEEERFSFFTDREGTLPIAEGCTYAYKGFEPDPHYFPEYPTSVWLSYELTGGDAACEAFKFVVVRPPHGDGDIKHMHLRYGDANTTAEALLEQSKGTYDDADDCNPWWSVYCTAGAEGCDG